MRMCFVLLFIFHAWDMCICETLYIFRFSTMRPWECTITLPCIRLGSLPREEVNDDVIHVSAQRLWGLWSLTAQRLGCNAQGWIRSNFTSRLFLLHHHLSYTPIPISPSPTALHQSSKSNFGGTCKGILIMLAVNWKALWSTRILNSFRAKPCSAHALLSLHRGLTVQESPHPHCSPRGIVLLKWRE